LLQGVVSEHFEPAAEQILEANVRRNSVAFNAGSTVA
jgi:hypothetical protein